MKKNTIENEEKVVKKRKKKKSEEIDFSQMKKVKGIASYKDETLHFYFSLKNRLILIIVIIILLSMGAYYFINASFAVKEFVELDYNQNGDIDYKVNLLENNYYSNNTLESGRNYVSSLVDSVDVIFKYNYYLSEKVDLSYNFDIIATLFIYGKDNSLLYSNDFNLNKFGTRREIGVKKLNLNENIKIDYQYFNKLAEEYAAQYGVEVTSVLKVNMNINSNSDWKEFLIAKNNKVTLGLEIPLLQSELSIKVNDFGHNLDGVYQEISSERPVNEVSLYVGLSFMILAVILLIYLISFIIFIKPKKTKYCHLRDGILKDYDRKIVNSRKMPTVTDQNIIDCYSFMELLDAQETLHKPIVYYEIIRNQKCIFIIIDNDVVYRYILKECDLDY